MLFLELERPSSSIKSMTHYIASCMFQELEQKRRDERVKQKQWEQKHRLGSFRRRKGLPGPRESDPTIGNMCVCINVSGLITYL